MSCSAPLYGRFADIQESRFQASKRSNKCSALLEGSRFADIHEFSFQAAKRSDMDCFELQGRLFADRQEWHFQVRKVQIRTIPSCNRVDLFMLRNMVFTVRNEEIWEVLSSNDLLMLRIRVFRLRIVQKYAVPSHNYVNLLMLRNRVFRLRIV